jgi:hypothetical protein
MLVELEQLANIIGADADNQRELSDIGPCVWQLFGARGDVIYLDVGKGCCEVISINPNIEPIESIIKNLLQVGEPEGGM